MLCLIANNRIDSWQGLCLLGVGGGIAACDNDLCIGIQPMGIVDRLSIFLVGPIGHGACINDNKIGGLYCSTSFKFLWDKPAAIEWDSYWLSLHPKCAR